MTESDIQALTPAALAGLIDHTFLKADGAPDAIDRLCDEAVEHGFACAMVNPCQVAACARRLAGTPVRVGTVIGFPLGQNTPETKRFEAQDALGRGADELDFVVDVRRLKATAAGQPCGLAEDLARDVETCRRAKPGVTLKLILEMCCLTEAEKVAGCRLAQAAGFDFVKTSTGFGAGGATAADVALMRRTVGPDMGVKAAGGIRDWATARALLAAGANRLGCSAGVRILADATRETLIATPAPAT